MLCNLTITQHLVLFWRFLINKLCISPRIQPSQNITCNRPRQLPCPPTCTAHNSSVSTVLQCPDNCVTVNVNICVIITCLTELCKLLCVVPNTLNITSVCCSLPCLYVAADVYLIYSGSLSGMPHRSVVVIDANQRLALKLLYCLTSECRARLKSITINMHSAKIMISLKLKNIFKTI